MWVCGSKIKDHVGVDRAFIVWLVRLFLCKNIGVTTDKVVAEGFFFLDMTIGTPDPLRIPEGFKEP